jgi:TolB protein
LVFLDRPLGRVFLADLAGGEPRSIGPAASFGVLRAHFLANGDLLLCGPARAVDASQREAGRFEGVLWVQRAPFDAPPHALGVPCWEGVATSRRALRIAWNRSDLRFTEASPRDFVGEIWTAELGYDARGRPHLAGVAKAFDRSQLPFDGVPEVQAFRGEDDRELILTGYGRDGIEVFGFDTRTGALRNYSNSPVYEEAEGLSPDGRWMLVERNIETTSEPGALDIWRLWLETNRWERLTHFNRYRGDPFPYYASNPVVAPDGSRFAFQLSIDGPTEGEGKGILVYELTR